MGGTDEVGGKFIGIKDLAIVENTFDRRQRGADKKLYLVCQIIYLLLMFLYSCVDLLQPLIDRISTQQIVFQHLVRPLTELCTAMAFYPIADRNDNIQIIIVHLIGFAVGSSVGKFCPH